jgi:hypothetical protein
VVEEIIAAISGEAPAVPDSDGRVYHSMSRVIPDLEIEDDRYLRYHVDLMRREFATQTHSKVKHLRWTLRVDGEEGSG